MADWLYTLEVKSLLSDDPEADYNADAIKIAPEVEKRIRALMERVSKASAPGIVDRLGDLYIELDEVADMFADVPTEGDNAKRHFNEALTMLYDIGDEGHRIWVK